MTTPHLHSVLAQTGEEHRLVRDKNFIQRFESRDFGLVFEQITDDRVVQHGHIYIRPLFFDAYLKFVNSGLSDPWYSLPENVRFRRQQLSQLSFTSMRGCVYVTRGSPTKFSTLSLPRNMYFRPISGLQYRINFGASPTWIPQRNFNSFWSDSSLRA